MANRQQRARTAQATVAVLDAGRYSVGGLEVSLTGMLAAMREGTRIYTPDDLEAAVGQAVSTSGVDTVIEVRNCTTFAAACMLRDSGFEHALCLNFASAKNPGGGFLSGSQAQEECLARASGLYVSLQLAGGYYAANRAHSSSLYTNHLIYSSSVPVFRDDDDHLLETPYPVSIITSPAVNAGAVHRNEPDNIARIEPMMRQRIASVLAVAHQQGHQALVLGAWGCGVFGNDPRQVATWFAEALRDGGQFAGVFHRIVFAVLDFSPDAASFNAFAREFA